MFNVETSTSKRAVYISGLGVIDDYMASDDLNECVDALLQKRSKAAFQQHAAALENAKKAKEGNKIVNNNTGSSNPGEQPCSNGQNSCAAASAPYAEGDLTNTPKKVGPEVAITGELGAVNTLLHSTSENSPEGSHGCKSSSMLLSLPPGTIPRVVIRHRIKGAKKAQKRLRKNEEQNKILLIEFQKNPIWQKTKIVELKNRLGLKESQIYKWNWDM